MFGIGEKKDKKDEVVKSNDSNAMFGRDFLKQEGIADVKRMDGEIVTSYFLKNGLGTVTASIRRTMSKCLLNHVANGTMKMR